MKSIRDQPSVQTLFNLLIERQVLIIILSSTKLLDPDAEITYYSNGIDVNKIKFYDDKRLVHRDNAPAIVKFRKDGSILYEGWYQHGLRHREDAPAEIDYNESGRIIEKSYFIDGKQCSEQDFNSLLNFKLLFKEVSLLNVKLDRIERHLNDQYIPYASK